MQTPSDRGGAEPGADRLVLAVDVGGTTIKAELVTGAGEVRARSTRPTPYGAPAIVDALGELATELTARLDRAPDLAGVVVPGLVDEEHGIADYSANLGWRDAPLADLLQERWHLPTRLGHDVRAAAIAEFHERHGADPSGAPDTAHLVIGTGIAATLFHHGRVLTSSAGVGCEIGHLQVADWPRCPCGGTGCLEQVASAAAITRDYNARSDDRAAGAADVAARLGSDPIADAVWRDAVLALADALSTLSLLFAPDDVVIGGGLGEAGDLLLEPLRAALAERARIVPTPTVSGSLLGSRAGVIGARLVALGHLAATNPGADDAH